MIKPAEYYQSIFDNQIHYAVNEKAVEIARELLNNDMTIEKVAMITKLPIETVCKLQETIFDSV